MGRGHSTGKIGPLFFGFQVRIYPFINLWHAFQRAARRLEHHLLRDTGGQRVHRFKNRYLGRVFFSDRMFGVHHDPHEHLAAA